MDFSEKFLYHIWDAQHLTGKIRTVSGKILRIIYQGRWNTDNGPDFKNAILKIGRKVVRGDVEIDRTTYDWHNHYHDQNYAFTAVILHVVFQNDLCYQYTHDALGKKVEILELRDWLDDDIRKLIKKYSNQAFRQQDTHCPGFADIEKRDCLNYLMLMGTQRIREKMLRFSAELYFTDFDQLAYQGIMEAMGYSKNKYQMLLLASNMSYKKLSKYKQDGMTHDEMIAILLNASGLIDHLPDNFPTDLVVKWKRAYGLQPYNKDIIDIKWNLFRIRPANNPAVRILQVSHLLYQGLGNRLLIGFSNLFAISPLAFTTANLRTAFFKLFRDSAFIPEKYIIGSDRLDVLMINVILPLLLAFALKKKNAALEKACWILYHDYPALADNHITKYMKSKMPGQSGKKIISKSILQQGLLHLYYKYCLHHNCEICLNDIVKFLPEGSKGNIARSE
ncbi:MAG: DUF2851 family protein [Candidatus Cloacimonetes bacterium]|nr:DUF2851 family protein [Candidatus Cloacimonadota bacterium]